jgi:hypothetical protein
METNITTVQIRECYKRCLTILKGKGAGRSQNFTSHSDGDLNRVGEWEGNVWMNPMLKLFVLCYSWFFYFQKGKREMA